MATVSRGATCPRRKTDASSTDLNIQARGSGRSSLGHWLRGGSPHGPTQKSRHRDARRATRLRRQKEVLDPMRAVALARRKTANLGTGRRKRRIVWRRIKPTQAAGPSSLTALAT